MSVRCVNLVFRPQEDETTELDQASIWLHAKGTTGCQARFATKRRCLKGAGRLSAVSGAVASYTTGALGRARVRHVRKEKRIRWQHGRTTNGKDKMATTAH